MSNCHQLPNETEEQPLLLKCHLCEQKRPVHEGSIRWSGPTWSLWVCNNCRDEEEDWEPQDDEDETFVCPDCGRSVGFDEAHETCD